MTEDRIKHALTNNLSWDISNRTPMGTKIGQFLKLFTLKCCKGLRNISASSILLQSHPKFEWKITKDPVIESAKLVFHEWNSEELSNLINIANASERSYGTLNDWIQHT